MILTYFYHIRYVCYSHDKATESITIIIAV